MKKFRRPTWLVLAECRRAAAAGDLQFLMMRDTEIHAYMLVEGALRALAAYGRVPRPKVFVPEMRTGPPKKAKRARKLAVHR